MAQIYKNLTPDQITQLEFQAGKEATRLLDKLNGMTNSAETNTKFAEKEEGSESIPDGFSVTAGYMKNMNAESGQGSLAGTTSEKHKCFSYLATEDMDVWLDMNFGSNQQIAVFEGEKYGNAYLVGAVYASNTDDYPMPTAENPLHVAAGQYVSFSYYNSSTDYVNITWTLYNVRPKALLNPALPLTSTMKEEIAAMADKRVETIEAKLDYLELTEQIDLSEMGD